MSLNALSFKLLAQGQQQSPLFSKLPPELRNRIYEMTFANELDSIDLFTVRAYDYLHLHHSDGCGSLPQCALLRSCQQVYLESSGIFDAASQAYWAKEFVLDLRTTPTSPPTMERFRNVPNRYLARICNLTFLAKYKTIPIKATWIWAQQAQTWQIEVNNDDSVAHEDQATPAEIDKIRQALLKVEFHRVPSRVTNANAKDEDFPSQPFTTSKIRVVVFALRAWENVLDISFFNAIMGGMAP